MQRRTDTGSITVPVPGSPGVATIESSSDLDVDPWQITDDGQFCRTWNVWDRGRPRCYRLYREGETFALHAVDRWGVVKLRRMNP